MRNFLVFFALNYTESIKVFPQKITKMQSKTAKNIKKMHSLCVIFKLKSFHLTWNSDRQLAQFYS